MDPQKIYALVRKIPSGKVSTYQELAKAAGEPKAARAVGKILSKNPDLIKTPCHRIVRSDGIVGGYAGGEKEKIRLLEKEGLTVITGKILAFQEKKFQY
ncbi:MAG: MGMT family protein [Candidatus Altiarchaeota archaeon]